MITDQDVERIAKRVVELIRPPEDRKAMSMKEAAEYLGLKAQQKSLASIFSRFSSAQIYKTPLRAHYIGRERTYYREDLDAFVKNRQRN